MKIAPIVFCSALAIFLATIAASEHAPIRIVDTKKVLDFSGIDTLEIKSKATAKIQIVENVDASVNFDSDSEYYRKNKQPAISVMKTGNKMTITTDIESYRELNLVIPPAVTTLIVNDADINAHDSPDTITIRVANSLAWQGDVTNIHITDSGNYSDPEKRCASDITIINGSIAKLFIETKHGMVKLKALDQIQATTLQVGPDVSLQVSPVSSMSSVQFQDLPGVVKLPENARNKSGQDYEYGCRGY